MGAISSANPEEMCVRRSVERWVTEAQEGSKLSACIIMQHGLIERGYDSIFMNVQIRKVELWQILTMPRG